jgi:carboxypeptidase family protein
MGLGYLVTSWKKSFGCCLLLTAMLPPVALAQLGSSGLNGVVTDASGAVVPRVTVTLISESEKFTRTALTNEAGAYAFTDLIPGTYQISAEASGFKKTIVNEVRLFVGHVVVQDLKLEVGTVTQEVSVTAAAPLLRQNTAEIGTIIEAKTLTEIPLNGRNFLQLDFLSPGVTRSKNGNTAEGDQLNPTSLGFNVNGQHADYNVYLLDGMEFKEYQHGSNTFSPNVDAIQEFNVASSNYSAELGSEAGAQVNLVLKSGTNQLHGDAYEFIRNDKLDARNFFAQNVLPFKRNQFGATVGGPMVLPKYNGRDRTFFFASYEGFRQAKRIPELGYYPTPAQLAGDLSSIATAGNPVMNPYTGQAFPGNIIPQSMMPSTLEPFLQNGIGKGPWVPVPNSTTTPGFNYFYSDPTTFNYDQVMGRIDQKAGEKTFLYGHYTFDNAHARESNTYPGQTLNPNFFLLHRRRAQTADFHIARPIRNNLLWEFSFGYSKFHQEVAQTTAFKNDITGSILGIKSGVATFPDAWGAPLWSVAGYSNLGEVHFGPRRWGPDIFQFRPAFSWIKGKHSMKFGGEVYRFLDTFQEIVYTNGAWSFNGTFTGYPLGDFLLGLPYNVTLSPTPFDPKQRYSEITGYYQDDWKATSHLTLNLGIRYEWSGIPFSANRSMSEVYLGPNNASPIIVVSDGAKPITFEGQPQTFFTGAPYTFASKVGLPESLVFSDKKNIGPRLGFAYTFPNVPNTVIRGGYGIFYQRDLENKWVDSALNAPFVSTQSITLDQTSFRSFDWFAPNTAAVGAALGLFANDNHYKSGSIQAYNLSLEHTAWNTLLSAAYVGNVSRHLPSMEFPNQPEPGPGPPNPRERWPGAGLLYWMTYHANATYNGLQLKIQRPFAKGFQILAGYTYSKTIDDGSGTFVGEGNGGFYVQDSYNRHLDKGLAPQDVRHRFVVSYIYQLPFGRGKPWLSQSGPGSAILGDWQINGITTFQTGSPLFVDQVCDRFNAFGLGGDPRPDLIGNPNNGPKTVSQWFNTSAFQQYCPGPNGPFTYGNTGRDVVIGPGIQNWDFAIYREFPFRGEANRFQFRAEFFNLANHAIFGQPGGTAGTPNFGAIGSTAFDSREIQFGFKFYF